MPMRCFGSAIIEQFPIRYIRRNASRWNARTLTFALLEIAISKIGVLKEFALQLIDGVVVLFDPSASAQRVELVVQGCVDGARGHDPKASRPVLIEHVADIL